MAAHLASWAETSGSLFAVVAFAFAFVAFVAVPFADPFAAVPSVVLSAAAVVLLAPPVAAASSPQDSPASLAAR